MLDERHCALIRLEQHVVIVFLHHDVVDNVRNIVVRVSFQQMTVFYLYFLQTSVWNRNGRRLIISCLSNAISTSPPPLCFSSSSSILATTVGCAGYSCCSSSPLRTACVIFPLAVVRACDVCYSISSSSDSLCHPLSLQASHPSLAGSVTILMVDLSLLQVSSPVAQHYTILIALVRYNRERHAVHCTVLGQHEHGRAVILPWHVAYLGIGLCKMRRFVCPVHYPVEQHLYTAQYCPRLNCLSSSKMHSRIKTPCILA